VSRGVRPDIPTAAAICSRDLPDGPCGEFPQGLPDSILSFAFSLASGASRTSGDSIHNSAQLEAGRGAPAGEVLGWASGIRSAARHSGGRPRPIPSNAPERTCGAVRPRSLDPGISPLLAPRQVGILSAMIARVHSSILQGIDAVGCAVEADVVTTANKPDIKLVGLADKAVQESVSRIQAALRNSGYRWPDFGELSRTGPKVTINLAPADVRKDSAALDLPIAVACMLASGQFSTERIDEYLILGELALDGRYDREWFGVRLPVPDRQIECSHHGKLISTRQDDTTQSCAKPGPWSGGFFPRASGHSRPGAGPAFAPARRVLRLGGRITLWPPARSRLRASSAMASMS